MKLAVNTNETTGNMVFDQTVRMEIDASASGIILDSLIRIYSNPYIAALREYTSNALDSHREAGQKRPIEVSLPSPIAPVFIVEDFGIGLSREGLHNYGQFGFSTKRDDNDGIGGFGLGSKVGLAFSSQYTVQAVKDGKLNVAIIGRDEDGNPQMGLLPEKDTDAPNGVKVMIPTSEHYKFQEAMRDDFFIGFPLKSIRIDGKFPTYSVEDADNFEALKGGLGWRRHRAARHNIGGIALVKGVRYRINWNEVASDLDYATRNGFLNEIVIDLPNGDVEIQRSRESLVYSKRTREVLRHKIEDLINYYRKMYQTEIDGASTIREALQLREKAFNFGFRSDYTWGGKEIKYGKKVDNDKKADISFTVADITSGSNSNSGYMASKTLNRYGDIMEYHGNAIYGQKALSILVTEASEATLVRKRTMHVEANGAVQFTLAQIEEQANPDIRPTQYRFYFTSAPASKFSKWFREAFAETMTAAEYMETVTTLRKEQAKVAAATRKANAAANAITGMTVRTYGLSQRSGVSYLTERKVSDLSQTSTYVVLQAGDDGLNDKLRSVLMTKKGRAAYATLGDLLVWLNRHADMEFISLTKSQKIAPIKAALANVITADELGKFIEAKAATIVSAKTDMEKRAILDRASQSCYWASRFPKNAIDLVKSKELRLWIETMKSQSDTTANDTFLNMVVSQAHTLGVDPAVAKIESTIKTSPAIHYPLLKHLQGWQADFAAAAEYINLVDEAAGRI